MSMQPCFSFGAAFESAHWFRQKWPDSGVSVSHPARSSNVFFLVQTNQKFLCQKEVIKSIVHENTQAVSYSGDFISVTIRLIEWPSELTTKFLLALAWRLLIAKIKRCRHVVRSPTPFLLFVSRTSPGGAASLKRYKELFLTTGTERRENDRLPLCSNFMISQTAPQSADVPEPDLSKSLLCPVIVDQILYSTKILLASNWWWLLKMN